MNLVNKVKNKWAERKFEKKEKDVIQIQQGTSTSSDQLETLRTGETTQDINGRSLTPALNNESEKTMLKKKGNDEGGKSPCHVKPNDICKECVEEQIGNKDKKLLKKYQLQEGNEQGWLGEIKILMEKQKKKSLEQQLTELMPLVRYHQEIKNVIKAKRIAVRQKLDTEPISELLNRLSELYGRDINQQVSRKINKRIKCHKCKKRGHLRKNCPGKKIVNNSIGK